MSDRAPLERYGPGWTTGPGTNRRFGELVRQTYRNQAAIMLPRRPDR